MKHVAVNKNNKSGIALVIVLGFILLLVVMSVSFVEIIRGERAASSAMNWGDQRDMAMQMAVSEIIADINGEMDDAYDNGSYPGDGFHPRATFFDQYKNENRAYRTFSAKTGSAVNAIGSSANLPLVPYDVFDNANMANNQAKIAKATVNLDKLGSSFAKRNLSYAYVAVDMSDYMDINWQLYCEGDPRLGGCAAGELDANPDFSVTMERSVIADLVNDYDRFNTCAELGMALGQPTNSVGRIASAPLFAPYSLYSRGGDLGNQISTSLNLNELAEEFQNKSATINPDFDTDEVAKITAIGNILRSGGGNDFLMAFSDYIDADRRPRSVENQCVEAIPLINEAKVTITRGPVVNKQVRFEYELELELWYPFAGRILSDADFLIEARLELTVGNPGPSESDFGTVYIPKDVSWSRGDFGHYIMTQSAYSTWFDVASVNVGAPQINIALYEGNKVDVDLLVDESTIVFAEELGTVYMEAVDPRLNYKSTYWKQNDNNGSINAVNVAVQDELNASSASDFVNANNAFVYVGDVAEVGRITVSAGGDDYRRTVGELGFILPGHAEDDMWSTLSLGGEISPPPNEASILDFFYWGDSGLGTAYELGSSNTERAKGFATGFFNPNNTNEEAWASFLLGLTERTTEMYETIPSVLPMPYANSYPRAPLEPTIEVNPSQTDLEKAMRDIAQDMALHFSNASWSSESDAVANLFASKNEMVQVLGKAVRDNASGIFPTKALRDGFVSVVADNVSVRQNLIGVYCWIGIEGPEPLSFMQFNNVNYNAQGRAFFLLWRDPLRTVPSAQQVTAAGNASNKGYHRNFVKYFQWLDEF